MAEPTFAMPPPLPKARASSSYIAVWGLLAALALAYLTLLATRPDMIARYLPISPASGTPEGNQGQRAQSDTLAEVEGLRSNLAKAESEIASLKSELTTQAERSSTLAERLSALESKATQAAALAPELPKVLAVADAAQSEAASSPPGVTVTSLAKSADASALLPDTAASGAASEAAVAKTDEKTAAKTAEPPAAPASSGVKVINVPPPASAQKGAALETGSVGTAPKPKTPIAFGPAVVKPSPKPVGIQIGTADTLDGLRLGWNLLADRHADMLKSLEPRYKTGVDDNGLTYDLLAGPVKSQADAKKLCKELTAKAVPCKVVDDFKGEAL